MPEKECHDNELVLATLNPDGPIQGVPAWSVISGNGSMIDSPEGLDPAAQALWNPALPPGYQMYLVSDTLSNGDSGPVDTVYKAVADKDMGTGVVELEEVFTLHVRNVALSLGGTISDAAPKPMA